MEGVDTVLCGPVQLQVYSKPVYGVVLWPAARVLAGWLAKFDSCGGPLLELGCGAGLCGMAFAKATGSAAVLTDGEDDVLELAKRNVELNGLRGVDVRCLDLGFMQEEEGKALIEEFGQFPLVVGSDMIFEPGGTARVLAAADQLLDSEGGRCVMALCSALQNFVVTLEAQGEAKGFEVEALIRTQSGVSLVVLLRGKPAWKLPAFEELEEAPSHQADQPDTQTCDRADLLFA
ncbi:unnamed protein product [Polarella glacialis]|uniref:Calmodulin-lysine N-methyltransferase n=1 Tax=Polarella glacialis TaxID=89957 RepID=A0A813EYJ8_POLGL|nr:unnamed protein product [Polarella glacialis]